MCPLRLFHLWHRRLPLNLIQPKGHQKAADEEIGDEFAFFFVAVDLVKDIRREAAVLAANPVPAALLQLFGFHAVDLNG